MALIPLDIHTDRLVLRPLTPSFLELTLAGDRRRAGELLGCDVPDDWLEESDLASLRLGDLRAEPRFQEWSLRAMIERASGRMVGHVGFHTRPGPAYLAPWTTEGVELGFAVYPPFRRLGFAREAACALLAWAYDARGVPDFIVSVSPDNTASMSLVLGLGFEPVGRHLDEVDGEEVVLLLSGAALSDLLQATRLDPDGRRNA